MPVLPPPTPPGYVEMAREVAELQASSAQWKRDVARFYVVSDRTDERLAQVLRRIGDLEQQGRINHEILRAIAAKVGVTP